MATDFGTNYSTMSIAVAGYLAFTAIIQLIIGSLSDRIGRRPVFLGIILIFTLASVGCALSQNIWVFLTFRMLQSAIAASYVLSITMVRDTSTEQKTASLIGYISMSMALAPMLGPMLGGVIDSLFGWRTSFYLYVLIGASMWVFCWFDLKETRVVNRDRESRPTQSRFTLLTETRFWAYSLCSAFSTGAYFAFIAGAPFVAKNIFNIATAELGIYVGSITIGYMFGAFLSGRLAQKSNLIFIMLSGRILGCAGLLAGMLFLGLDMKSTILYFGCTIFVGLGNGLTVPSSNAGVISVRPEMSGGAAGLSGALTVLVGAVLTMLTGSLMSDANASTVLLVIMFTTTFLGLLSVLWIGNLKRSEGSVTSS